jgi:hypothetical protein
MSEQREVISTVLGHQDLTTAVENSTGRSELDVAAALPTGGSSTIEFWPPRRVVVRRPTPAA